MTSVNLKFIFANHDGVSVSFPSHTTVRVYYLCYSNPEHDHYYTNIQDTVSSLKIKLLEQWPSGKSRRLALSELVNLNHQESSRAMTHLALDLYAWAVVF
jgi:hypothetical protein